MWRNQKPFLLRLGKIKIEISLTVKLNQVIKKKIYHVISRTSQNTHRD